MKLKLSFNVPVTLGLGLLSLFFLILNSIIPGQALNSVLSAPTSLDLGSLLFYPRLFTHIMAHSGWAHYWGNLGFLLILGPLLEEKYGSWRLLSMILVTAFLTAFFNALLFSTGVIGASGIVFMFIVLGSFVNTKSGTIPATAVLVVGIWLSKEVFNAISDDNISQFAHIISGVCGSIFGVLITRKQRKLP